MFSLIEFKNHVWTRSCGRPNHLVLWTTLSWVLLTSCGLYRLKLLNICSSCRKQKQVCDTRTVVSKTTFFFKSLIFVLVPWEVSSRSGTLRPLGDLQGTSPTCRVPDRTPFIALCFYRDTCIHKHIYIHIYIYKQKPSKVILSDHLAEIFFVIFQLSYKNSYIKFTVTLRPLGDLQGTSPTCRVPDRTPFIALCFYRDTCIHKHIYIHIYIYKQKPSKVILSDHLAEIFFVIFQFSQIRQQSELMCTL